MKGPMHGIRVLDLSTIVAGPMTSRIFADQGADVIKVESPPVGDLARLLGSQRNEHGSSFQMFNRGKRSIAVNLKSPEGADVLRRLIASADVLIQNMRPGIMKRLGFDYEAAHAINPNLIYASISGFGDTGPMAKQRAYDHMVQCYTGFAAVQIDTALGDGEPHLVRNVVVDKATALTLSQAVTAALFARERGAGGQHLKLSLMDSAVAFIWADSAVREHFVGEGWQFRRAMAEGCRLYTFKNGYATFSATDNRGFFGVCEMFGAKSGDDPRLAHPEMRSRSPELMAIVDAEWDAGTRSWDVDEAMARMAELDVACAKVLSLAEVPEHPQIVANEIFRVVDHPVAGKIREVRQPVNFSGTPTPPAAPSPAYGQHTEEILAEIGLSGDEINKLWAAGALV